MAAAPGLGAASPTVRAEAHRLRRLGRPLDATSGLVPSREQRALARALGAPVIEPAGDHDVPRAGGDSYGRALRAAVDVLLGVDASRPGAVV